MRCMSMARNEVPKRQRIRVPAAVGTVSESCKVDVSVGPAVTAAELRALYCRIQKLQDGKTRLTAQSGKSQKVRMDVLIKIFELKRQNAVLIIDVEEEGERGLPCLDH